MVFPTAVSEEAAAAALTGEDVEATLPSENGAYLNGTDVTFTAEGEEENIIPALSQEASDAEEQVDAAGEGETYEEDTDDESIAEEAEALDEEADEVLDEIAEEGYDEEEGEGFEEETYITPEADEEEEYTDEDVASFKVDEDGELIEEHGDAGEDDNDEEEDKPDEEKK
jgi:segregation and condensation protein B